MLLLLNRFVPETICFSFPCFPSQQRGLCFLSLASGLIVMPSLASLHDCGLYPVMYPTLHFAYVGLCLPLPCCFSSSLVVYPLHYNIDAILTLLTNGTGENIPRCEKAENEKKLLLSIIEGFPWLLCVLNRLPHATMPEHCAIYAVFDTFAWLAQKGDDFPT